MDSRFPLVMVLLICSFGVGTIHASGDAKGCFSISLTKGKTDLPSPSVLTFYDSSGKVDVPQVHGNYCIPTGWQDKAKLDMSFISGKDRLSFFSITTESLTGAISISYGKTGKATPKRACTLVFHRGEPEIALMINPCVVPAKPLK